MKDLISEEHTNGEVQIEPLFSINKNTSDNPVDLLHDVMRVLDALKLIFMSRDAPEMNESQAGGLVTILDSVTYTLESAERLSTKLISEPFGAGYRKAMYLSDGEYLRGVREGRGHVFKAADRLNPDLGNQLRSMFKGGSARGAPPDQGRS